MEQKKQLRWRVWEHVTGGGKPYEYIAWINEKWREWGKKAYSDADHAEFDAWLKATYDLR